MKISYLLILCTLFICTDVGAKTRVCQKRPGSKIKVCTVVQEESKVLGDINQPILSSQYGEELELNFLIKIDNYVSLLEDLDLFVKSKMSTRKSRRKLRKIIGEKGLGKFCGTTFLSLEVMSQINERCVEGFFNICPNSYSNVPSLNKSLYKNLIKLFDDEEQLLSECTTLLKGAME